MSGTSFTLKGGPALSAFLEQLPAKLVKKVARGGMRKGAAVFRDSAKEKVRRKSGKTAKAIKTSDNVKDGVITAKVTLKGEHSFLGLMIENGVAPHFISVGTDAGATAKERRAATKLTNQRIKRGSLVINGKFVGDEVHHPGVPAHPFMRPAFDENAEEAINAVGSYIRDRLTIGDLDPPLVEVDEE